LTLKLGDNQVVEQIRRHRWPNGVKCPYCGSSKVIEYGKAPRRPYLQRYFCTNCRRQFNDLTSTPLAEARGTAEHRAGNTLPLPQARPEPVCCRKRAWRG